MEIKDLVPRQGKVDIEVEITEKGEIREFEKFGKSGKVCNATVTDGSGTVALTLWNEDIDRIKVGDKVKIENGYVSEWQGEKQLSTGKFGKLEVVGSSSAPSSVEDPSINSDQKPAMEKVEEEVIEDLHKDK